jgi:hypothetical protein
MSNVFCIDNASDPQIYLRFIYSYNKKFQIVVIQYYCLEVG